MYDPRKHHRRSIRLKDYDYSKEGLYFVTLCTKDKIHLFGEIINGEMHLNSFGEIAAEEWKKTEKIRKNISLGEFIIMPDHMHMIISIDYQVENNNHIGEFKSPSQTVGAIIRGFKGATTKRINKIIRDCRGELQFCGGELQFARTKLQFIKNIKGSGSIWQRDYYEKIIRTDKALKNISNYIINNPENWEKD